MITALTASVIVTGVGFCILEELDLAVTPEGHGRPKRVVYMTPGQIAWDACDCGQLALSVVRDYPSNRFPIDSGLEPTTGGCHNRALAYEVTVSLTWCTPGLKNQQPYIPTPTELLTSSLQFEADAYAMRNAIECCLSEMKRVRRITDWRFGELRRVGPDGFCAGVEGNFFFQLT